MIPSGWPSGRARRRSAAQHLEVVRAVHQPEHVAAGDRTWQVFQPVDRHHRHLLFAQPVDLAHRAEHAGDPLFFSLANLGVLVITHYQRLLNYIKPDYVHVMLGGRIVESGGPDLALHLEEKGYEWIREKYEETPDRVGF